MNERELVFSGSFFMPVFGILKGAEKIRNPWFVLGFRKPSDTKKAPESFRSLVNREFRLGDSRGIMGHSQRSYPGVPGPVL